MRIVAPSESQTSYDNGIPDANGNYYTFTDYMGTFLNRDGHGPQIIRHMLPGPNPVIPPHYHVVPEFQVFIRGDFSLGKHRGSAVLVHFVDDFTPYGPLRGGESGIEWFLMRPQPDYMMHVMPGSRATMVRRAGRDLQVQLGAERPTPGSATPLIERHADGLAMHRIVLAPNQIFTEAPSAQPGGQAGIILGGSISHGGSSFGQWSCLYNDKDDPAAVFQAGDDGADFLLLNYPDPASALLRMRPVKPT